MTMTVTRKINGKKHNIRLTANEMWEAHRLCHVNFYLGESKDNYPEVKKADREGVADRAYDIYCEGDGLTEYEALETAIEEYKEVMA